MEDGADVDYFDLEDLARLRRNVRKAIEDMQREREVYHDMVLQYLEVIAPANRKLVLFFKCSCQAGLCSEAANLCCCLSILHLACWIAVQVSDVLSNRLKRGQPFVSSTRQHQLPTVLGHMEWWWRCILRGWVYRYVMHFSTPYVSTFAVLCFVRYVSS